MNEVMNVNVLLCEDCDESLTYISKVFNGIVQENDEVSFNIVSLINTIEYTKTKFSLHYFLMNMEKNKVTHIGDIKFESENLDNEDNNKGNGNSLKSIVENSSQISAVMKVEAFEFPNCGAYELLVYKYEDEEADKAIEKAHTKEKHELRKRENLVATYCFLVKAKEE